MKEMRNGDRWRRKGRKKEEEENMVKHCGPMWHSIFFFFRKKNSMTYIATLEKKICHINFSICNLTGVKRKWLKLFVFNN